MKIVHKTSLILLLSLLPLSSHASEQKKQAAEQEAGKWLALVDGGQYEESWQRTAKLFRRQVSVEQWLQAMSAARSPMGNMTSRKLLSAVYRTSLPGAPDGEYVVLQYETSFNNKQNAIETITPMMDEGSWKVSGYYVR